MLWRAVGGALAGDWQGFIGQLAVLSWAAGMLWRTVGGAFVVAGMLSWAAGML